MIATVWLFRSDNELISGPASTSATKLSGSSSDADAAFPISLALPGVIAGLCAAGAAATSSVAGGGSTMSAFASGLTSGAGSGLTRRAAAQRWQLSAPAGCALHLRLRLLNDCNGLFGRLGWRCGHHSRRHCLRHYCRRSVGRGDLLLFDALTPGALPFDAVLPAGGAMRATGATCFAARGRATGSTRSNSASSGAAT